MKNFFFSVIVIFSCANTYASSSFYCDILGTITSEIKPTKTGVEFNIEISEAKSYNPKSGWDCDILLNQTLVVRYSDNEYRIAGEPKKTDLTCIKYSYFDMGTPKGVYRRSSFEPKCTVLDSPNKSINENAPAAHGRATARPL